MSIFWLTNTDEQLQELIWQSYGGSKKFGNHRWNIFSSYSSLIFVECDSASLSMWLFCLYVCITTDTETDRRLLTACDFKQHFVIEAQSEFRHPRQDHFELDSAYYFTPQDAAIGAHL